MFKPKSDADLLLYSLSHFECDGHTVHMLTQQHLLPPLTSTVKLSLFTHVHSRPLSWVPGYIDAMQTVLIILTVVGFFQDRSQYYSQKPKNFSRAESKHLTFPISSLNKY